MSDVIELRDVTKTFRDVVAVDHVSLGIRQGEFFALLGPSGCGKTTTLRMLAGFERPTSGSVWIRGVRVNDVPPYRRETNLVFQQLALFPHMDVYDNVAFGLRVKGRPAAEIRDRVQRALDLVELGRLGARRVHEISGGQQQRVAFARALVNEPAVLLLDEPLGSLDMKLRLQMQQELKSLQRRLGTTFVYVTHDQSEALAMADRVAVMEAGRIAQLGTPEHIYTRPASRFVADFIGDTNLFEARIVSRGPDGALVLESGGVTFNVAGEDGATGESRYISLRPEKVRIASAAAPLPGATRATVASVTFMGPLTRYKVLAGVGLPLTVQVQTESEEHFRADDPVQVAWSPTAPVVLRA